MRLVFFGCDDFANAHLERLIAEGHTITALVTRPDRPKGRGLPLVFGDTKKTALQHSIDVLQPDHLNDDRFLSQLKQYGADVFVVVAYGHFLPEAVLLIPKYFCVNVHPSLLPKYRGAAPINWALINGETRTGVTLIRVNASMDGGDILAQEEVSLPEDMTSIVLREQLKQLGAQMLCALLPRIGSGEFTAVRQDAAQASRAPKLTRELGAVRWDRPAKAIHDLVRGTQPWPGAYITFKGKGLKILETVPLLTDTPGRPGEIVELYKDGFGVKAASGVVLVRRVHPAGSKPMDARSFLAGHRVGLGDILD